MIVMRQSNTCSCHLAHPSKTSLCRYDIVVVRIVSFQFIFYVLYALITNETTHGHCLVFLVVFFVIKFFDRNFTKYSTYLNANKTLYEHVEHLYNVYYVIYIYKVYSVRPCISRYMRGNNIRIAVNADIDPCDLVAREALKRARARVCQWCCTPMVLPKHVANTHVTKSYSLRRGAAVHRPLVKYIVRPGDL